LLFELGLELCNEYTRRYGKTHKTKQILEWCLDNKPQIPDIGFTKPSLAMPDDYKTNDVVESYRRYYVNDKKEIAKWKDGYVPNWFILS
jgi:hypothetical protein